MKPGQFDYVQKVLAEYRNAGEEKRFDMYLFHRELRNRFDAVEREELMCLCSVMRVIQNPQRPAAKRGLPLAHSA